MVLGQAGPGETSGNIVPDPEVVFTSPGRTVGEAPMGLFKSLQHHGKVATTSGGRAREPDDGVIKEDDFTRLLRLGAGNQEDATR
ncbi:hypothetical protein NDU88_005855 [Pleurodeles waltl]|uniref:Uncharacterized protein n=1 Tax=Pleurodeles waltl TaxID=8319 RepID=A0AAV7LDS7_PLEWA|nr:hypothetical protein NDU88_005855 [Pleurodeles waltl]